MKIKVTDYDYFKDNNLYFAYKMTHPANFPVYNVTF